MATIKCEYTESYCSLDNSPLDESAKAEQCADAYWDCECCSFCEYLSKKFENTYKRYELCIDSQKDDYGCHFGYLKIGRKEIDLSNVDYLEIDEKVYIKQEL